MQDFLGRRMGRYITLERRAKQHTDTVIEHGAKAIDAITASTSHVEKQPIVSHVSYSS